MRHHIPLLFASLLLVVGSANAADEARQADEAAIREAAARYIDAVRKRDAKAMAACWTATGDFVDDSGESYNARDLIEKRASQPQNEAPPNLSIKSSTIRFLGPESALEDGISVHEQGDLPPLEGRYLAIWVKRDGKWLLDAVRESPLPTAATSTPLAELEWMVGSWRAERDGHLYDCTTRWNEQQTFLIREFRVSKGAEPVMAGLQIIGWDAAAKAIRSWAFDAAGGFTESQWDRHDDLWAAQSSGVLPDGRRTHALNLHSFDGTSWVMKSCHSEVGDEDNPDLLLVFTRVPNS